MALPPAVRAQLQQRLAQPQGFPSYGESQRYLAQAHDVHLGYSPVHGRVRYQRGAKPKAPRRAHPPKPLPRSPSFASP